MYQRELYLATVLPSLAAALGSMSYQKGSVISVPFVIYSHLVLKIVILSKLTEKST